MARGVLGIISKIKNTKARANRALLFFLAFTIVFSLVQPGANLALAEAIKAKKFDTNFKLDPLKSNDAQKVTSLTQGTGGPLTLPSVKDPKGHKYEDVGKRTAFTSTYVNNDGTKTMEYSVNQRNYKDGSSWKQIDNHLDAVAQKAPDPTLWQTITSTQPKAPEPEQFKGKAGTMSADIQPLADGITMNVAGKTIVMKPIGAHNVKPTKQDSNSVIYKDAWPNVDLEYELRGESIKEIIIVKNKNAQTDFNFSVTGGRVINHPTRQSELTIEGLPDEYSFSALTLSLQDRGVISESHVSQAPNKTADGIAVTLDKDWVKAQPASSFPMRIDPSLAKDSTGYWMFKSDGYSCGSSNCYANIGTIYDGGWKYWRSYVQFPFSDLSGKKILNATLHGYFKGGIGGDQNSRGIAMGHANCIGFWCQGSQVGWTSAATDFDINFTNGLQQAVNNQDWGTVWSLWGEEGGYTTYKPYMDIAAYITYDTPTPIATPITPSNKQVVVDTQPTLKVNPVSDADGDTVKYYFRVSTSGDAETGAVINSGWIDTPQWSIPDGILQDGTTYYWHVYTLGATQTNPNYVSQFKVDLRGGKDSTQSYETVGPVGVDLATGNASVNTATHNINTLGGSMGLSLAYNTPNRAKKGLKGEYWNVASGYNFANGAPSSSPATTVRDSKIDFAWGTGAPSNVSGINADWFYTRWTGQFVAPTTGTYQFGGSNDDNMHVWVNNVDLYNQGCYSGVCYDNTKSVQLTAGQVVPIRVEYMDATSLAYAHLYVKGAVAEQVVPSDWLYTDVSNQSQSYGLMGRYYTDNSNAHDLDTAVSDPSRLMLTRRDTNMSLNFGLGGPAAGMQTDNFMARWTGYITVPKAGQYKLGADSDDGIRIKVNTGSWQTSLDSWTDQAGRFIGNAVSLPANTPIPIQVDWFEHGGGASINLLVQSDDASIPLQNVPTTWLTPDANVLPDQWKLGIDASGNVNYERLRVSNSSVILEDATGSTHEYTYTNGGYKPPVNEDGTLSKNADNTYTFTDVDGRVYVFDTSGQLSSLTSPADDRQPAALKYTYAGSPSRLVRVEDGTTSARYATVYYKGVNDTDNICDKNGTNNPSTLFGLVSSFADAPTGKLCAFKTSDGDVTNLYYDGNGNLARIVKPGGQVTDYAYDEFGRITSTRDSLAADAIAAGVRTNDESVTTQLSYDSLGRVTAVKEPAAKPGDARIEHTLAYAPGSTDLHMTGASEPNGFSKRIQYDSLLRTTADTDLAGKVTQTEWDPVKDQTLSTTDPTGLKSTTIYDQDDRATDSYGPAPVAWYGSDRKPTANYISQVPHTNTGYDEGTKGFAVSWYNLKSANMTMVGAPKFNHLGYANGATAMNPARTAFDYRNYALPMTPDTSISGVDGYGLRATGKITFPATGTYTFRTWADDSIRLSVDDQILTNNWGTKTEGVAQNAYTATFSAMAGKTYRVQIEYGHVGTPGAFEVWLAGAGIPDMSGGNGLGANDWSAYLKPGYDLTTSSTVYDSRLGDTKTTTQYSDPAYGTVSSKTLDPTGLNYTSQATYETPGSGYLRQISSVLPGGATSSYQYYSGSDTRDNPCTTDIEAYHQAGRLKSGTDATGRVAETVYNESGDIIATRYNDDPWTCLSYDSRGRIVSTVVPAVGDKEGRAITANYAVGGNPLISSISDITGTVTTETDLLGRALTYTDARGNVTNNTYDNFGKLVTRTSPVGTETYEYDSLDRLSKQKLDGITYASINYDEFSRIDTVDYPAGMSLRPTVYDSLGRTKKITYNVGGVDLTDDATRATSGLMTSEVENGVSKTYTYDKADRLTNATVGSNTFTYGYGAPDASCSSLAGNNPNAAKEGNRSSYTLNGQTTTYCYNAGDQLIASSDARFDQATYDTHGNTTSLGDATHKTEFTYDATDRNVGMKETTSSGNRETTYQRDVNNRIYHRVYAVNGATADDSFYGFTGAGDDPSFLKDANGNVVQKYLNLAGGVKVTVKMQNTGADAAIYSVSNIQGNTMATADANGVPTIIAPSGPFGEKIDGHYAPANAAAGTSNDFMGLHRKATESDYLIQPIQMGARVYIPELGRFLQVDSVEGGASNAYTYALDPVNQKDINGQWLIPLIMIVVAVVSIVIAANSIHKAVKKPTPTNITIAVIDTAAAATAVFSAGSSVAAGRAASAGVRAASAAASSASQRAAQLAANKAAGKEAERIALERAQAQYGKEYELRTQQYYKVDGYARGRFADITAYKDGKPAFNIEVKSGNARYEGTIQEDKDQAILEQFGVPTRLSRIPLSGR